MPFKKAKAKVKPVNPARPMIGTKSFMVKNKGARSVVTRTRIGEIEGDDEEFEYKADPDITPMQKAMRSRNLTLPRRRTKITEVSDAQWRELQNTEKGSVHLVLPPQAGEEDIPDHFVHFQAHKYCKFQRRSFGVYGLGVYLYFTFLVKCMILFSTIGFVLLPSLIMNAGNSGTPDSSWAPIITATTLGALGEGFIDANATYGILDSKNRTIPLTLSYLGAPVSAQTWTALMGLLDFFASILFLLYINHIENSFQVYSSHYHTYAVTAGLFTIQVDNLPANLIDRIALAEHFEKLIGPVADVSLAFDDEKFVRLYAQRGSAVKQLRSAMQQQEGRVEGRTAAAQLVKQATAKLDECNRKIAAAGNDWLSNRVPKLAFVTFECQQHRTEAAQLYGYSWMAEKQGRKKSQLLFQGKELTVTSAADPSNVNFPNIKYTWSDRFKRRMLSSLMGTIMFFTSFTIVFFTQRERRRVESSLQCSFKVTAAEVKSNPGNTEYLRCFCGSQGFKLLFDVVEASIDCSSYASEYFKSLVVAGSIILVVVIVNVLVEIFGEQLGKLEKWPTLTEEDKSTFFFVFIGQFLNTGLAYTLVSAKFFDNCQEGKIFCGAYADFSIEWFSNVGSNIVLTVGASGIFKMFPPFAIAVYNWWQRKRSKDTDNLDVLFQRFKGPKQLFSARYACIMNLSFVCLLYCGGIPLLPWVLVFCFGFIYIMDKYWFLRIYKTPPKYDQALAMSVLSVFRYGILLHLAFSVWFYSAPIITHEETTLESVFKTLGESTEFLDFSKESSGLAESLPVWRRLGQSSTILLLLMFSFLLIYWTISALLKMFACMACRKKSENGDIQQVSARKVMYTHEKRARDFVSYHIHDSENYVDAFITTPEEQQLRPVVEFQLLRSIMKRVSPEQWEELLPTTATVTRQCDSGFWEILDKTALTPEEKDARGEVLHVAASIAGQKSKHNSSDVEFKLSPAQVRQIFVYFKLDKTAYMEFERMSPKRMDQSCTFEEFFRTYLRLYRASIIQPITHPKDSTEIALVEDLKQLWEKESGLPPAEGTLDEDGIVAVLEQRGAKNKDEYIGMWSWPDLWKPVSIDLKVKGGNLPSKQPVAVYVSVREPFSQNWKDVGWTERIQSSHPAWTTELSVLDSYKDQEYRFAVYNLDNTDASPSPQALIGEVSAKLIDLLQPKWRLLTHPTNEKRHSTLAKRRCSLGFVVTLKSEENEIFHKNNSEEIVLLASCANLPTNRNVFVKCERKDLGSWTQCGQTEVAEGKVSDPSFTTPLRIDFAHGPSDTIRFSVMLLEKSSAPEHKESFSNLLPRGAVTRGAVILNEQTSKPEDEGNCQELGSAVVHMDRLTDPAEHWVTIMLRDANNKPTKTHTQIVLKKLSVSQGFSKMDAFLELVDTSKDGEIPWHSFSTCFLRQFRRWVSHDPDESSEKLESGKQQFFLPDDSNRRGSLEPLLEEDHPFVVPAKEGNSDCFLPNSDSNVTARKIKFELKPRNNSVVLALETAGEEMTSLLLSADEALGKETGNENISAEAEAEAEVDAKAEQRQLAEEEAEAEAEAKRQLAEEEAEAEAEAKRQLAEEQAEAEAEAKRQLAEEEARAAAAAEEEESKKRKEEAAAAVAAAAAEEEENKKREEEAATAETAEREEEERKKMEEETAAVAAAAAEKEEGKKREEEAEADTPPAATEAKPPDQTQFTNIESVNGEDSSAVDNGNESTNSANSATDGRKASAAGTPPPLPPRRTVKEEEERKNRGEEDAAVVAAAAAEEEESKKKKAAAADVKESEVTEKAQAEDASAECVQEKSTQEIKQNAESGPANEIQALPGQSEG